MNRWLFGPGSPQRLAALRIGLFFLIAWTLLRSDYAEIASQPPALFQPLSFMQALERMPPVDVVRVIHVLAFLFALLAAVGWRARLTMPLAWIGATFLGGMNTSFGKVMHNDVLLLLCALPLVISPSSDAWSLDARRYRRVDARRGDRGRRVGPASWYGWPVNTAVLVVAGAYAFAGLQKVISAGPAWVTSGNMRWVMYAASDAQASPNAVALFIADRPWLAHALAAVTLVVELGAVVIVVSRRARPWFVAVAFVLHVGIWMAMRLDYSAQMATVAIVLIDWPAWIARARGRARVSSTPAPNIT